MHRRNRLSSRHRFEEVRRHGQAHKERLAVLVCFPNDLPYSRFGFTASKRVGKAVRRNRARRLLREAIRLRLDAIAIGWDVILIARPEIAGAAFADVDAACGRLLQRAHLLIPAASPARMSVVADES